MTVLTLLDERDGSFQIPKGADEDVIDLGRLDMSDVAYEGWDLKGSPITNFDELMIGAIKWKRIRRSCMCVFCYFVVIKI